MHVETSTIVAILLDEPEANDLLVQLNAAERPVTSVINAVEAALSIGRNIKDHSLAGRLVLDFLEKARIDIVAATPDIYDDVIRAYARYGKGTGHPARLNFGDCFSYAFAKRAGVTLLYKGSDFSHTDLAAS